LQWLEADLEKTTLPIIVFCHQGLTNDMGGIENAKQSPWCLEMQCKGCFPKSTVVFSGHHHLDYHNVINGIHYIQITHVLPMAGKKV